MQKLFVIDEDVDDGLSQAIIKVLASIEQFDPQRGNMEAWVFVIAEREILNIMRQKSNRRRRETRNTVDKIQSHTQNGERVATDDQDFQLREDLIEVLLSLSDTDRQLILDYAEGAFANAPWTHLTGSTSESDKSSIRVKAFRLKQKIAKQLFQMGNVPTMWMQCKEASNEQ